MSGNNYANMIKTEFGSLKGKTVATVRALTPAELALFYWHEGFVIVFTDGTCFIPSSDEEGNDAGFGFVEKVGE